MRSQCHSPNPGIIVKNQTLSAPSARASSQHFTLENLVLRSNSLCICSSCLGECKISHLFRTYAIHRKSECCTLCARCVEAIFIFQGKQPYGHSWSVACLFCLLFVKLAAEFVLIKRYLRFILAKPILLFVPCFPYFWQKSDTYPIFVWKSR